MVRQPVVTPPRKVERYNVESYQCLQEDTWASISKKKYLTERYAEALQAFNMQNPQTSDRLKRDGRPAPGDEILVPPAWLLGDRHGSLIRREDAAPPPGSSPQ